MKVLKTSNTIWFPWWKMGGAITAKRESEKRRSKYANYEKLAITSRKARKMELLDHCQLLLQKTTTEGMKLPLGCLVKKAQTLRWGPSSTSRKFAPEPQLPAT